MNHKDCPPADFEVPNPAAAFDKLERAARHIMAVPKKKIDAMMAKAKPEKPRKSRGH
jgi:hypothetical protein